MKDCNDLTLTKHLAVAMQTVPNSIQHPTQLTTRALRAPLESPATSLTPQLNLTQQQHSDTATHYVDSSFHCS